MKGIYIAGSHLKITGVFGNSKLSLDKKEKKRPATMKGCYALLIRLPEKENIEVGKRGSWSFRPGYYAYVGSAMGGLEGRINYHLGNKKRLYWHIDYLLAKASIEEIIFSETPDKIECALAQNLGKTFSSIAGFGASDCKCESHLYFARKKDKLRKKIKAAFSQAGFHSTLKHIQEFNPRGRKIK